MSRFIITIDGRRAKIAGVSRSRSWDGVEVRPRVQISGSPPHLFEGGLFVVFDGGARSFVANATYGKHWRLTS